MIPYRLIHKVVNTALIRSQVIDRDELMGIALLSYVMAEKSYKPDKGASRTTWAFNEMKYQIMQEQNKALSQHRYEVELDAQKEEVLPPKGEAASPLRIIEILAQMSTEAQQVCEMVLSSPEEFIGSSKAVRGRIYRRLREEGWAWSAIWDCFREIKTALNESN